MQLTSSKRARRIVLACVGATIVVGAIVVYYLRSSDLAVAARDAAYSLAAGDASRLYKLRAPEEVRQGVPESAYQRVVDELVVPVQRRLKRARSISAHSNNDPHTQGVADIPYALSDGRSIEWGVITEPTEVGPRSAVLYSLLVQAWTVGHYAEHPEDYGKRGIVVPVKLAGLRRDRAKLESWGMNGMVGPHGQYRTWDQWEQDLTEQQRRVQASEQRRSGSAAMSPDH